MDSSKNNDIVGGMIDGIKNIKDKYIVIVLTIMIVGILVSLTVFYYRIFTLEERENVMKMMKCIHLLTHT